MLKEIQKQPEHIRELIMWLSVAIVFSGVIYFWFGGFQSNLVALLNPEAPAKENSDSQLASTGQASANSPLIEIKEGIKNFGASLWGLFDFLNEDKETKKEILDNHQKTPVQNRKNLLPISK